MCSVPLQFLLALFLLKISNGEEITFKNVTIKWDQDETNFATGDNLKKIIPSEEKIFVRISGDVPVLHEKSIYGIPNLRALRMVSVGLEEIKHGAFGNLSVLHYLDLSSNKLTEIKSGTFCNLKMTTINLASNLIISLQPGAFKNITVQNLRLNNNKLTELPSTVFENVTVRNLELHYNYIHTIAPQAFSTICLESLVLYNNKLEKIDPEALNISELKMLALGFNQIEFLRPGDLKNLPQLEELSFINNNLVEIPEGVFNNTKIKDLNLHYNKIIKIGTKAFDDMSRLEKLDIAFNNLSLWDNNWLNGSSQLSSFKAGYNQITEIPDEAFKNYPRLVYLGLQENKIGRVSMKAFHKLEHVVNLDLFSNEIDSWGPDLLANVSIDRIDLSRNKLKCIEGDLDQVFRNVADYVSLWGNPWSEGCAEKMREFVKKKKILG